MQTIDQNSSESANVKADDPLLEHRLAAWRQTVDVQMHFNTIEMQIRNLAITVLAALFGASVLAPTFEYEIFGLEVNSIAIVLIGGVLALSAFYFMDRFHYHRLLKGSVDHAKSISEDLGGDIPEIRLGEAISAASKVKIPIINREIRSTRKIDLFYGLIALVLLLLTIVVLVDSNRKNQASVDYIVSINGEQATAYDFVNGDRVEIAYDVDLAGGSISLMFQDPTGKVSWETEISDTASDVDSVRIVTSGRHLLRILGEDAEGMIRVVVGWQ